MNSNQKAKLEVWYDSWCPMCQQVQQRLTRLDWKNALQFESIREPKIASKLTKYGLTAEQVEKRMHVVWLHTQQMQSGIHAVAAIAKVVPALWVLYPGLAVLARTRLGEKLYDAIAGGRTIVPVGHCTDGVCPIKKK